MQYGEFMKDVRERAGVDEDRAEKAVRATLNTLAQRLAAGEPHDLASQLPEELKETGTDPGGLPAAGLPWFMTLFGRDNEEELRGEVVQASHRERVGVLAVEHRHGAEDLSLARRFRPHRVGPSRH